MARQAKADLGDSSVGARVGSARTSRASSAWPSTLEVPFPTLPYEEALAFAEAAHQVCPYSNATRGNMEITLNVVDD